jgi:hypothetical protein
MGRHGVLITRSLYYVQNAKMRGEIRGTDPTCKKSIADGKFKVVWEAEGSMGPDDLDIYHNACHVIVDGKYLKKRFEVNTYM